MQYLSTTHFTLLSYIYFFSKHSEKKSNLKQNSNKQGSHCTWTSRASLASVNNVIADERVNIVTPDSRWMETWMETPRRAIGTKVRGVRSFVHEGIGSTKSQGTIFPPQKSRQGGLWECSKGICIRRS